MFATLFLSSLALTAAFAPASKMNTRSSLKMASFDAASQIGAISPTGFFDPLGNMISLFSYFTNSTQSIRLRQR
jgi:hypothetical protein